MIKTDEKYKLVDIIERTNKENKKYYLAVILLKNSYDCDLIKVLVRENQVQKLYELSSQKDFDISNYLEIQYNNYSKSYQPVIKL